MKKINALKAIFIAILVTVALSGCDAFDNEPEVMGLIESVDRESDSDDFLKVDSVDNEYNETEFELAGDVPYVEENEIEIGEIPEDDEGFVKLDPVDDKEKDGYFLEGDIAFVEEESEVKDDFVLEDEAKDENMLVTRGMIPLKE